MTLPLSLLPSRLKKYQKIANPDQILRGDNLLQWSSILFGWGGGGWGEGVLSCFNELLGSREPNTFFVYIKYFRLERENLLIRNQNLFSLGAINKFTIQVGL